MKKALIGVAAVVSTSVALFVAAVVMQPSELHVERDVVMAATPPDVFPLVGDFANWSRWDPWQEMDPDMKHETSDPSSGLGAWTSWDGNDDVGAGKQTIIEYVDNEKVVQNLEFYRPFASVSTATLTFAADGEGTKVTWALDSEPDFMGKMAGMFMDMDALLGADFERGLGKLKVAAEDVRAAREEAERLEAERLEAERLAAEATEGDGETGEAEVGAEG